ncbi:MAG: hypothetical protein ACPHK8_00990 [Thermoplasmatota archaeon]
MSRWLQRESTEWVEEGIIDSSQRERILARYSDAGWQQQVLSLLAGSAIGASIIAIWALLVFEMNLTTLEDGWSATLFFLAFALPLLGFGIVTPNERLGRPAVLAGLIPLLVSTPIGNADWYPWVVLAALGGAFAATFKTNLRAVLIAAAISIVLPMATMDTMDDRPAMITWFLLAAAVFAGAWLTDKAWSPAAKVITGAGVAASWLAVVIELLDFNFDGSVSLTFSAGMLALVGLSVWQKESGPTLLFGLALTIGLIAFAFESGGPIAGVIALVALSAGFLFLSFRKRS